MGKSERAEHLRKNKAESRRVAAKIHPIPQQCFSNAFRVITALAEYQTATYVEGIAVTTAGRPLEHGWIERNGEIIDPTFTDDDYVYFSGLRFQGVAELKRAMKELPNETEDDLPIFYRFGWGGADSPEMMRAWHQASAYSKSVVGKPNQDI